MLIADVLAYHRWTATTAMFMQLTTPDAEVVRPNFNLPVLAKVEEDAIAVTNNSSVIWNCTLVIPRAGSPVTTRVEVPPRQTRRVVYGAFSGTAPPVTANQLHSFAREHLSASCEVRQGNVKAGTLR